LRLGDHPERGEAWWRAPLVTLGEDSGSRSSDLDELLAIDQAMTRLASLDERQKHAWSAASSEGSSSMRLPGFSAYRSPA